MCLIGHASDQLGEAILRGVIDSSELERTMRKIDMDHLAIVMALMQPGIRGFFQGDRVELQHPLIKGVAQLANDRGCIGRDVPEGVRAVHELIATRIMPSIARFVAR